MKKENFKIGDTVYYAHREGYEENMPRAFNDIKKGIIKEIYNDDTSIDYYMDTNDSVFVIGKEKKCIFKDLNKTKEFIRLETLKQMNGWIKRRRVEYAEMMKENEEVSF